MRKNLLLIGLTTLTLGLTACAANSSSESQTSTEATTQATTEATTEATTQATTEATTEETKQEENTSAEDTKKDEENTADDAAGLFNKLWAAIAEDEKFPAMGGDIDNSVNDMPGKHDLANKDALVGQFYIPEAMVDSVDDVATLMHMMNANTFTGVMAHVSDAQAFADAVSKNISETQWICGFPDKLIVAEVTEGNVFYAFGEASIIESFTNKITDTFENAKILNQADLAPEFDF